jgi:putative MATE family efflux protein
VVDESIEDTEGGPGRGKTAYRDWTKGNILRNLLSLSWPMVVSNSLNMLGPTIDMIWVGKLGSASIAGVGIAGMAVMVVNSARMGLTTGTRAMIARFFGGGDIRGSNHVAQQAFIISAAFSIIMAVIGIALAEVIMRIMGVEPDVVSEGAAYMRIMFIGSVAMSFRMMGEGIMQASGDAQTPMRIAVFFRLFHVALCPFLIFGWWIFPRLGVSGAALTNVISQSLGVGLSLWVLFSGRSRLRLTLKGLSLDRSIIWRIVKIGIPASITGIERSFANLVLVWFIVPFGTFAVAAHTVVQRASQFLYMPSQGFGQAAGVLAGQNLGAGQPGRAERTGWLAAGVFTSIMLVSSVVVFLWAENIVRIFNSEPDLVEIASTFLRIEIVSYLVFGLVVVLSQCLNGVGDTAIPMITTLLTMWLVQVPLAYFLPRITGLGVYGVRWAIVTAIVMRAIIYTAYFRSGRWKRKKV